MPHMQGCRQDFFIWGAKLHNHMLVITHTYIIYNSSLKSNNISKLKLVYKNEQFAINMNPKKKKKKISYKSYVQL